MKLHLEMEGKEWKNGFTKWNGVAPNWLNSSGLMFLCPFKMQHPLDEQEEARVMESSTLQGLLKPH